MQHDSIMEEDQNELTSDFMQSQMDSHLQGKGAANDADGRETASHGKRNLLDICTHEFVNRKSATRGAT